MGLLHLAVSAFSNCTAPTDKLHYPPMPSSSSPPDDPTRPYQESPHSSPSPAAQKALGTAFLLKSAPKSSKPSQKSRKRASPDSDDDWGSDSGDTPCQQLIYRSRSASAVQSTTDKTRNCTIEADGDPTKTPHISSYNAIFQTPKTQKTTRGSRIPFTRRLANLNTQTPTPVKSLSFLEPKDKDHYNPIMDLERSLYTIVDCYLTPAQQAIFGTLPSDYYSDTHSKQPLPPAEPYPEGPYGNLLRSFQRAIHIRDGPLFSTTLQKINTLFRELKYPSLLRPNLLGDVFLPTPTNELKTAVSSWPNVPKNVLLRVVEENYQRSVGPHVQSLKQYEAFSSTVYGELMPSLVYDILANTNLDQNSLFIDLGSGVGNILVHASLQTGCRSYGIELMPAPAGVAKNMVQHFATRCRMWGVSLGNVEAEEGDMLEKADVVLVDNKVFDERLNEAIRAKFLDLKEGAIVVSLKPVLTERNVDDMSAIFDVQEKTYRSGDVSWGPGGGTYYVHRTVRSRFENSRISGGRRSRTSR
ncbi:S-adenosyl-L-methionine-dependent methyltransferase [Armillaria novae-zelandiae]|uniref:Histone-lysine N-methyltransferase, H3 lysine-79 specific n=1 Tax=Armillaria novae-zelandiae TaxID=153914 RepID=A0AA39NHB9_9AGAR|nr:S-adenosyl-L-methionine-dependent methyltransferase [Armillaria novae-zelandiae]